MGRMKIYADSSERRTLQVLGDLLLVAWVILWLRVAETVRDATLSLAAPGEHLEEAGDGLAGKLRDAGDAVDGIPLVGDDVRTPFDGAGDAAARIAAAGTAQVEAVQALAFWLSLAVGAIPIVVIAGIYLPMRWRFVREATAGRRYLDAAADLDLFALRAMAHQPMHRLARVSDDPVRAWRDRDPAVVRALAVLELGAVGLTAPEPEAGAARSLDPDGRMDP